MGRKAAAAQSTDGRTGPWGNEWKAEAVPGPDRSRNRREPSDVDAHPKGVSPFGVMDTTGNVWQWTDEFLDEHTRAAILRGGRDRRPRHRQTSGVGCPVLQVGSGSPEGKDRN
ncbi:MAG: SUMF1/EgtB/PvdO family nonheme iron enzyme [Acidobacteriota bacterium]